MNIEMARWEYGLKCHFQVSIERKEVIELLLAKIGDLFQTYRDFLLIYHQY